LPRFNRVINTASRDFLRQSVNLHLQGGFSFEKATSYNFDSYLRNTDGGYMPISLQIPYKNPHR
jgi:hypothetical protein